MLVNGKHHGPCVPREALHDLLVTTWQYDICGWPRCSGCDAAVGAESAPGSCGTAPAACAVVRACIALGLPVKGRENP